MWKIIFLLFISVSCFGQSHVEYISEKCDSMALISRKDINIVNNVFSERNRLDSLNKVNNKIIQLLEIKNSAMDSIINNQVRTIHNNELLHKNLQTKYSETIQQYQKDVKKERRKTTSFQITTGLGIVAIILLILI